MKKKLVKEARKAERQRRKDAIAKELERIHKLEQLRQRTETIIKVIRLRGGTGAGSDVVI